MDESDGSPPHAHVPHSLSLRRVSLIKRVAPPENPSGDPSAVPGGRQRWLALGECPRRVRLCAHFRARVVHARADLNHAYARRLRLIIDFRG